MKSGAIARIIIWSIVAVIFTGVLITGINSDLSFFNISGFKIENFNYKDSDKYLTGEDTVTLSDIKNVEIYWREGNVNIVEYSGSEIQFSESSKTTIAEDDKLRYNITNDKLIIQFSSARKILRFFSFNHLSKDLEVRIPKKANLNLDKLSVNAVSAGISLDGEFDAETQLIAVSGNILVDGFKGNKLSANSVSGKTRLDVESVENVKIKTVSGPIDVKGRIKIIDFKSVSGRISFSSVDVDDINVDSISGSVELQLREKEGFNLSYNTVSGKLNSDFPIQTQGEQSIFGNGAARFRVKTVSGNLDLIEL